jgi:hypothetical protein
MEWLYSSLADVTVALHLAYVLFVIVGLAAIVVGIVLRWQWVRNFWFRSLHLLAITFVALESIIGMTCPLTDLEYYLRKAAGGNPQEADTFVGRLLQNILFYDVPEGHWGFTVAYVGFAVLVLATFVLAPPRWPRRKAKAPVLVPQNQPQAPVAGAPG